MEQCGDISGKEYYQNLINEAPFIPGDHGISPKKLDIPNSDLFDKELIDKGKQFVRRNLFGVTLALMVAGLHTGVVRRIRVVLLRQNDVRVKEAIFKRVLANLIRVLSWYQSDFTAQDTRATKDLNAVRATHNLAARGHSTLQAPQLPPLSPDDSSFLQGVQQVTNGIDDSDSPHDVLRENVQVPISQFDLVQTQFGLIGPLLLHPKSFGVHDTLGFEGLIRLCSLIGRQLGIQDRFNLALHYEKTGGKTDAFRLIEQNILMACFKQTDATALIIWKKTLEGISAYVPVIRFKPSVQLMLKALGSPAHLLDEHMDWRDRVSSFIVSCTLGQITKWAAGRLVCNSAVCCYLWIAPSVILKGRNFGKK